MDTFVPQILPEAAAPSAAVSCQNCELCTQRDRVIWGEGNLHAPVFVVLDNPGLREDKDGRPFLCGTRQALLKAVHEAGIDSSLIFVSYVLKCRPRRTYDKEKARSICINYLFEQIDFVKPTIVVCLGNVAVQSYFQDSDADAKHLRGSIHNVRGYKTAVSYHPLAVRRRPVLYKYFLEDWNLVAKQIVKA